MCLGIVKLQGTTPGLQGVFVTLTLMTGFMKQQCQVAGARQNIDTTFSHYSSIHSGTGVSLIAKDRNVPDLNSL